MSHKPAARVFDLAASAPWAITEDYLKTILEIASRENLTPESVAAQLGRPLDNAREAAQVRDGIAVIPVVGPIFRYADFFSQISGATTVEEVATDLGAALRNPAVKGILFSIDSPGGEANGVAELAHMIRAAGETKPTTAYVGGMGASGGYWLAAAAQEVVISTTAIVGSIGVRMAVPGSRSGRNTEFISSQSPNKRPDPSTEAGRQQLQALVDSLAGVFVADVAKYRKVSEAKVLSDFGAGGVLVGRDAVSVGMADRLGTFEETLAGLVESTKSLPGARDASRADGGKEEPMAEEQGWMSGFRAWLHGSDKPPAAGEPVPPHLMTLGDNGRLVELEAQVTALTRERDDAKAALLVAVNDRLTDYLADCQRLGQGAVEAGMIADGIRASGDYAKAKALAEEKREQVFARYPAGTSANVKSATAPPDGGQAHAGADAVLEAASSAAKDRRERAAGNGRKP